MRQDFGRCVIERPRAGSHNRSLKIRSTGRFRWDEDELIYEGPSRIPNWRRMHGYNPGIGEKSFTDLLGPVDGYLLSAVGRRWDDVFSEVSAVLGGRGQAISHVLNTHLLSEVDTCTYWENGKVYGQPGGRRFYGTYYVHPESGILCREPEKSRKYVRPATQLETDRVHIAGDRWYVKLAGIWYIGHYTEDAAVNITPVNPLATGPYHWYDPAFPNYRNGGRRFIFVKSKQANRKELRNMRSLRAESDALKSKLR